MKQVGIASDVNCPGYRFIGSGNNVSLRTFIKYYKISQLIHTQSIAN